MAFSFSPWRESPAVSTHLPVPSMQIFWRGGSTAAVTATESYTVRVGHGIPGWTSIVSMVDASVVVHVGGYSGHTTSVDRLKI